MTLRIAPVTMVQVRAVEIPPFEAVGPLINGRVFVELEGRNGYAPAKMALGGLMADFFYQNEDRLYPRRFGFQGGDMYVTLRGCIRHGWRGSSMNLEGEREQRRRRDDAA